MTLLLFGGLLLLNVLISWWNTYVVGSAWKDTHTLGNWFDRAVLYSAVVQSSIGFSMPILMGLGWVALQMLTSGENPDMTPEQAAEFIEAVFSLWYVLIAFPILLSGWTIWVHSIREAMKRRDFTSIGVAAWNSYANISNTVNILGGFGEAFGNVGELFKGGGDGKGKALILAILIVVIAIMAGFLITISLVKYYAARTVTIPQQRGVRTA